MSSYQPGIPTGTVDLDVDYLNIQANFQQLDTSFGIDHLPFSNQTAQNGYHTSIHLNPVSTTTTNPPNNQPPVLPTVTPGFGQVFSCEINDGINTDEALYFLTGGNRLTQLTRNFAPVANTKGSTFLPGGFILNWGYDTSTGGTTVVTLAQKLPGNFFSAQATFQATDSTSRSIFCRTTPQAAPPSGITTISFQSSSTQNFFWWVLGN